MLVPTYTIPRLPSQTELETFPVLKELAGQTAPWPD